MRAGWGHACSAEWLDRLASALGCSLALSACSATGLDDVPADWGVDAGSPRTSGRDAGLHRPRKVDASLAGPTLEGGARRGVGDAGPSHDAAPAVDVARNGKAPFFDAGPGCGIGAAGEPTTLACTGLYADWESKTVAPGVLAYTPGLELWSDGAVKRRWVSLPPGTKIDTSNMDEWTFPVGTRLWKEFSVPVAGSGLEGRAQRVETRLLWKVNALTWYRTTYRWSADGEASAVELTDGQPDANGLGYEVPTQTECLTCHEGRLDDVLGFEAVSLAHPNAAGLAMPQLVEAGLLTDPPEAGSLAIPGDHVTSDALGWLHINCGVACHNEGAFAVAEQTGFWARLDEHTLKAVRDTETWATAWDAAAEFYYIPGVAYTDRLRACSIATSSVYYRSARRDGVDGTPSATQMPPLDTHRVDDAGLAVLAAWIDEHCDAGAK